MSIMRNIQRMFGRGNSNEDEQAIENFKKRRKAPVDRTVSSFDRADWHYDSVRQQGLPDGQMYVPGGMLLGWLVEREFISDEMYELYGEEIDDFLNRRIGAADLYQSVDGKLNQEMLSPEGARFMHFYFSGGNYFTDYENVFNARQGAQYGVQDTWQNYEMLSRVLEGRLRECG